MVARQVVAATGSGCIWGRPAKRDLLRGCKKKKRTFLVRHDVIGICLSLESATHLVFVVELTIAVDRCRFGWRHKAFQVAQESGHHLHTAVIMGWLGTGGGADEVSQKWIHAGMEGPGEFGFPAKKLSRCRVGGLRCEFAEREKKRSNAIRDLTQIGSGINCDGSLLRVFELMATRRLKGV